MEFYSILFPYKETENWQAYKNANMPDYFEDLNIDQVVGNILKGKEKYKLNAHYCCTLTDAYVINYRLDIMKDLENKDLFAAMQKFAENMSNVWEYMGQCKHATAKAQKEKWHMDSAELYVNTLLYLCEVLQKCEVKSQGFTTLRDTLENHISGEDFTSLSLQVKKLANEFAVLKYGLTVKVSEGIGKGVVVNKYSEDQEQPNTFIHELNETFKKINEQDFSPGIELFTGQWINPLEIQILNRIVDANKPLYKQLTEFFNKYPVFVDPMIARFENEIQFYLAFIEFAEKIKETGITFTYPVFSSNKPDKKEVKIVDGYDLSLAIKKANTTSESTNSALSHTIVSNDFFMKNNDNVNENIFILTGINQGGKTTFIRTLGQIFYFASIGYPVACKEAQLFVPNGIFIHFAQEEALMTNSGRLREELVRLNALFASAQADSIIFLNEIFASTTNHDAYEMGTFMMDRFAEIGSLCIFSTHVWKLASYGKNTVSLIAESIPVDGKQVSTYKIKRKEADEMAFGTSLAEKYKLTYDSIKERVIV